LLAEKLDVKVNKHFQKADWGVRPLSSALLLYAALDTHYLILLRDLLDAELRERGLRPLAQEDFDMACDGTAPRPKPESQPWEHFARGRGLNRRDLTVVKHVLSCREHIAARLNRPPFKVVDDERVVEIAKAKPSTLAQLKALGLTARQVESWGSEVLAGVQAGLNGPLVTRTALRAPSGTYLRRLERLKAWRKKAAAGMEVESDVVLPRGLMLALAEQGSRGVGTVLRSSPWRLQHFGDAIAGILVEAAA
jgi:ribonuclease D